jgi:hypothetical protein
MKSKYIVAIWLFIIVFFILGVSFTQWWFYGADDYHALFLAYQKTSWKDILGYFFDGHVNQGHCGPTNYVSYQGRTSFLGTYYRPIYLMFHAVFYKLFGVNGYYFHLINVFFHAANVALIFLLLSYFIPFSYATIAAIFFAVHPQIAYRFGAFVNLQYYLNVFFILLLIIFYKKFLDTNKTRFYIISCLLFALSLFTRELTIVFPVIIFLGVFFYKVGLGGSYSKKFFKKAAESFFITLWFWIIDILYLLFRLWLYPLRNVPMKKNISWGIILNQKFLEFQVFFYDLFSLSWLPWGRPFLRIVLVFFIVSFFLFLFMKNRYKEYVLFFIFSGFLMLWPAIIGPYSPRYFYESSPFFLAAFVLLFRHSTYFFIRSYKRLMFSFLYGFCFFLSVFCFLSFCRREEKMATIAQATYDVVEKIKNSKSSVCFVAHPVDGYESQNAAIYWVLLNDPSRRIYFDSATGMARAEGTVVKPGKWYNRICSHLNREYVIINREKNILKFSTSNPSKVHFSNLDSKSCSLGEKEIHHRKIVHGKEVVTEFVLKIDKKYFSDDLLFLRWNSEDKKFNKIT